MNRTRYDLENDILIVGFGIALLVGSIIVYLPYMILCVLPKLMLDGIDKMIDKMTMKTLESVGHVLMGFGAGLVNARLLLTKREFDQLPPENDKNPVIWNNGIEYWSKIRVMDTLHDSREYDIGGSIAWFFVLGLGGAIGYLI